MRLSRSLQDKRILITGITGFIGSHLAKKLLVLGAKVYGISRTVSKRNIYKVDILDHEAIHEVINKKKIEICFHLAGESLVEVGQKEPYKTFEVNTLGTLGVLEAARKNNLERIIIASSSHVYGKNKLPYYEGYIPRPSRPYETSKACTDLIAQSYADTYSLPVLIPRFVNIYGPYDLNFNRVIPQTIRNILLHKTPKLWGVGTTRDYLFVDDAVDAYLSLAVHTIKDSKKNRIYNFGSGNPVSVADLMQKLISISGSDLAIEKIAEVRPFEIQAQYVSFAKARRELQWEPRFSLEEGLRNTFQWYKSYFSENKRIAALL